MHASFLSVIHIRELAAESTLDHSQYNIRGAFCSPGGEDHVGILVFTRLASEGEELAKHVLRLGHENGQNLLQDLCQLHQDLKTIENKRGAGIYHGEGVTPRTRRILLETISKFTQLAKETPGLLVDGGTNADNLLREVFYSAVLYISKIPNTGDFDEVTIFQLCEITFDIASFDSSLVSYLFSDSGDSMTIDCVNTMIQAGMYGYKNVIASDMQDNGLAQVSIN